MTVEDFSKVCSYPLWVNDDGFSVMYSSREELEKYMPIRYIDVKYVTVNGEGELVVEI